MEIFWRTIQGYPDQFQIPVRRQGDGRSSLAVRSQLWLIITERLRQSSFATHPGVLGRTTDLKGELPNYPVSIKPKERAEVLEMEKHGCIHVGYLCSPSDYAIRAWRSGHLSAMRPQLRPQLAPSHSSAGCRTARQGPYPRGVRGPGSPIGQGADTLCGR